MKIKYVVVLGDGMADRPLVELNGQTPLSYARTPHMDRLASGVLGMVRTVPEGFAPGSDVANLAVMGFDPRLYYTGRSPLEAVSMGINLGREDVAFRCNLVTLSTEGPLEEKTMVDYSAGEISSEESRQLISAVNEAVGEEGRRFYPGISYRHLLVWMGGPVGVNLTPPHDISGRPVGAYLPQGERASEILTLMQRGAEVLQNHPVNKARQERALRPANAVWFWGQGRKPSLPRFVDQYGLEGAVISAVDLIKGIGRCAGMDVIDVPGATGNIHTNFRGKAEAALAALQQGVDFVYVHVEAPDEAGHQGDLETKIRAIEAVDKDVLGEIIHGLQGFEAYRLMVLPDHPTPLETRTHADDPVPFAMGDRESLTREPCSYSERSASASGLYVPDGPALLRRFLANEGPGGGVL